MSPRMDHSRMGDSRNIFTVLWPVGLVQFGDRLIDRTASGRGGAGHKLEGNTNFQNPTHSVSRKMGKCAWDRPLDAEGFRSMLRAGTRGGSEEKLSFGKHKTESWNEAPGRKQSSRAHGRDEE